MNRSRILAVSSATRFLVPGLLSLLALVGCESAEQPATGTEAVGVSESPESSPRQPAAQPDPAPQKPRPVYLAKVGLQKPKSVLHDPEADVYLVSNINGTPLADDDNGFISKVAPDGTLIKLRWIDGESPGVKLSAPKGMAISADSLYVADVGAVRVFDRRTGKPTRSIQIKGATFLNDVAVGPRGRIYVSDTGFEQWEVGFRPSGTDAVYRIEGTKVVPLIKSPRLGLPTGLTVDERGVWVVTRAGELFLAAATGAKQLARKLPKATLDGIVKNNDGELLISSWDGKCIYRSKGDGPIEPIVNRMTSPADIGYDAKRNRLLIPLLTKHMLVIHPL